MQVLLVCLIAFFLAGCSGQAPEQASEVSASPQQTAGASLQTSKDDLSHLQREYERTKEEYRKDPTEENAQRYADAIVGYANAVMYSDAPPKEKYPKALQLYEEALKVDPNNKVAQENRQTILDIYKSLGRKPPEGGK